VQLPAYATVSSDQDCPSADAASALILEARTDTRAKRWAGLVAIQRPPPDSQLV